MKQKPTITLIKETPKETQTALDLFTDHIDVKIEPITSLIKLPTQSKDQLHTINLFTDLGLLTDIDVASGNSYLVNTGVALAFPEEIHGKVAIQGCGKGEISLYSHTKRIPKEEIPKREYGDLMLLVKNNTNKTLTLHAGEPIAQIVFHHGVTNINIQMVSALPTKKHIHFGTIE